MVQRFLNRPQRRQSNKGWAAAFTSAPVNVPAASKVLLFTFTLSNENIDETVLRTVGTWGVRADAILDEEQIGAVGMIIVSDTAAAAGVASIPGPITNADDDGWFLYTPFTFAIESISNVGVRPDITHMIPFDSKAKRKSSSGKVIACVVENAHATDGFDFTLVLRLLAMVRGT